MKILYEITPKSARHMTMQLKGGGSVTFTGKPRKVWLTSDQTAAVRNTPGRFDLGQPEQVTPPPAEAQTIYFADAPIRINPDGTIGEKAKLKARKKERN